MARPATVRLLLILIWLSHLAASPIQDSTLLVDFDCSDGQVTVLFTADTVFCLRFPNMEISDLTAQKQHRTTVKIPGIHPKAIVNVYIDYSDKDQGDKKHKKLYRCNSDLKMDTVSSPPTKTSTANALFQLAILFTLVTGLYLGFQKIKGKRKEKKIHAIDIELLNLNEHLIQNGINIEIVNNGQSVVQSHDHNVELNEGNKEEKTESASLIESELLTLPETGSQNTPIQTPSKLRRQQRQRVRRNRFYQNEKNQATANEQVVIEIESNSDSHNQLSDSDSQTTEMDINRTMELTAHVDNIEPEFNSNEQNQLNDLGSQEEKMDIDTTMKNPINTIMVNPQQNMPPPNKPTDTFSTKDFLFQQPDILTSYAEDNFRNDVQMVAFMTVMASFAVQSGPWERIAIMKPTISWFHDNKQQPITLDVLEDYILGHSKTPNLILYPANIRNVHWVLIAVDLKLKTVQLYDPLQANQQYANAATGRMHEMERDLKKLGLLPKSVSLNRVAPTKFNEQDDSENCGVYVALYAEQIAFYGYTWLKAPFDIIAERTRFLNTCKVINKKEGKLDTWQITCKPMEKENAMLPDIKDSQLNYVTSIRYDIDADDADILFQGIYQHNKYVDDSTQESPPPKSARMNNVNAQACSVLESVDDSSQETSPSKAMNIDNVDVEMRNVSLTDNTEVAAAFQDDFDMTGMMANQESRLNFVHPERNDAQIFAFLLTMARFVCYKFNRRIAVMDPQRGADHDARTHQTAKGARSKLYGHQQRFDTLLYPANIDQAHWILIVAQVDAKKIYLFDSMDKCKHTGDTCKPKGRAAKRLDELYVDLRYFGINTSEFTFVPHGDDLNLQDSNTLDCGVFVAFYAEQMLFQDKVTKQSPFDIEQERNRFFDVCIMIDETDGLMDEWPETCKNGYTRDPRIAANPRLVLKVPLLINNAVACQDVDCMTLEDEMLIEDEDDEDSLFSYDSNSSHVAEKRHGVVQIPRNPLIAASHAAYFVNDVQMIAFITVLIRFAQLNGPYDRIALVSPAFGYPTETDILKHYHLDDKKPELVLFPTRSFAHSGHWYLIVANMEKNTLSLYDPLALNVDKPNPACINNVKKFNTAMRQLGLLDGHSKYEHPQKLTYRNGALGTQCGIYVARYAEELAFTATISYLTPFNIDTERERFYAICSEISKIGCVRTWPETVQEKYLEQFELPDDVIVEELDPPLLSETSKPEVSTKSKPAPVKRLPRHATENYRWQLFAREQEDLRKQLKKMGIPLGTIGTGYYPPQHYLGGMTEEARCPYPICRAYLFPTETSITCCANGDVVPIKFTPEPGQLVNILKEEDYWNNVYRINVMFSMVSASANHGKIMDVLTMGGIIKFNVGDILADPGRTATFQQIYQLDEKDIGNLRMIDGRKVGLNNGDPRRTVKKDLLGLIEAMLRIHHPLTQAYQFLIDKYKNYLSELPEGVCPQQVYLIWESGRASDDTTTHKGCLGQTTLRGQKFMAWKSGDGEPPRNCLMIATDTGGFVRPIASWNSQIPPCLYPLMFYHGQLGWSPGTLKQRFVPKPPPVKPITTEEEDDPTYTNKHVKYGSQKPKNSQTTRQSQRIPNSQTSALKKSQQPNDVTLPLTTKRSQKPDVKPNTVDSSENETSDSDDDDKPSPNKIHVSERQFFRSSLFARTLAQLRVFHPVTSQRDLFQMYVMERWLRIDTNILEQLERVQRNAGTRFDVNSTLRNTLQKIIDNDPKLMGQKLGKVFVIPDVYRGGARDMQRQFRNAIAICLQLGDGRCDFFITYTGNPNWPEIVENLRPGETWLDRPDLVCRVFKEKCKVFVKDILDGWLGSVKAYNFSLEHQKRGMPHIHMLIILTDEARAYIQTVGGLESLLSAELPEKPKTDNPTPEECAKIQIAKLVETLMMHRPSKCKRFCGMSKLQPGTCKKKFPRPFSEETTFVPGDYAQLKRPNNGRSVPGPKGIPMTNQHVVTHNPGLLLKHNTHINVEYVGNVFCMKYLYKYTMKGHDQAFVTVNVDGTQSKGGPASTVDYNEFVQQQQLRVINPTEAGMRAIGHPVTKSSHNVVLLHIHLEGEHITVFGDDEPPTDLSNRIQPGMPTKSKLLAYMATVELENAIFNGEHGPTDAPNLHYGDMPRYYTWDQKSGSWNRRERVGRAIARIQIVFPRQRNLYALRELLIQKVGVSSYASLLKVGDTIYDSFYAAAVAQGYLIDDDATHRTMEELFSIITNPRQCRYSFAMIVVFNRPDNTLALWNEFKAHMLDNNGLSDIVRERRALIHIASILDGHGLSMADVGLDSVDESDLLDAINAEFPLPDGNVQDDYDKLNDEQRPVVDSVIRAALIAPATAYANSMKPSSPRQFFVQGSGGTGKTFVYNIIIRMCIEKGLNVISVASTGIAAVLLIGGQTVHSAFKLPLDMSAPPLLSQQSATAQVIRRADVIVWDEAPMQHHNILRNVDELFRQVLNSDHPFAGKVMLLGGDFKQLLPVIKSRMPIACYNASLLASELFTENFEIFTLTRNVRAQEDPDYAQWLEQIGTGKLIVRAVISHAVYIKLYPGIETFNEAETIDFVYPSKYFNSNYRSYDLKVKDRAILVTRNIDVDRLNLKIMTEKLEGEFRIYQAFNEPVATKNSADEVFRDARMPEELAMFEASHLPPQRLRLKIGTVVMLTRNLDIKAGLCNGTRMIIRSFGENLIFCDVVTGNAANTRVAIFRIRHLHDDPLDDRWPAFNRIQFPLRPAFAMTINKSQGQTLAKVGVILNSPVFAHGQLYVALSRVRNHKDIRVCVPLTNRKLMGGNHVGITVNVVFHQVLAAMKVLWEASRYYKLFYRPGTKQLRGNQPSIIP